jgi:predicted dehydrogenase
MKRIKTAVLGAGFMGKVHSEAIRRLGFVDIVAVAAVSDEEARGFGNAIGVDRTTSNYKELLADPTIDAVHVCTPNSLHAPMSKEALLAGKAVLCEKPLTMNVQEAEELVRIAKEKNLPNCVNHNLRYYPAVQQIRDMVKNGDLGEVLIVNGTYFQDWLLYDTDYNWRVERAANGDLRAMGDIGSHWMDMIQHLTGLKITALCADLATFHKSRKKPNHAVETFTGKKLNEADYTEIPMDTDDFGSVLVHLGDRARGNFAVSQMSAGCKNRFQFEIFGTKAGVAWNQERPDEIWMGARNTPNSLIVKDGSLFYPHAAGFADLPGGHSEGYDDAHKQVYKRFYKKVADPSAEIDYPTFEDGLWGMRLLAKVLESSQKGGWVSTDAQGAKA